MPYQYIKDLPQSVRHVLPAHGQEIYFASFNNAYEEYKNKKKRQDPSEDLEAVAHKVAWAAVKQKYHKTDDGKWVKK